MIDGFNIVITLEVLLSDSLLFSCMVVRIVKERRKGDDLRICFLFIFCAKTPQRSLIPCAPSAVLILWIYS